MELRPDLPQAGADFALGVADAVPSLRPVVDEHLEEHPELLPHILFGEVTECAKDLSRRGNRNAADELARLLDYLEGGMRDRDPYVVELIRDSFIENAQPTMSQKDRASEYAELRSRIMEHPLLREAYIEIVGSGD